MRAKAEIVDVTRARKGIEITELPYLVGPERVIAKVKDLINANRLSGHQRRQEPVRPDKSGLRLVIECKTGVNPELLLEQLYKLTPLEESFGINNVVLVDGVPTTVGLYDLCRHYIDHRLDVVVRRTEYRLRKARGAPPPGRGPADRHRQHRRGGPDHPQLGRHPRGQRPSSWSDSA